jgi:hypothetical protein
MKNDHRTPLDALLRALASSTDSLVAQWATALQRGESAGPAPAEQPAAPAETKTVRRARR